MLLTRINQVNELIKWPNELTRSMAPSNELNRLKATYHMWWLASNNMAIIHSSVSMETRRISLLLLWTLLRRRMRESRLILIIWCRKQPTRWIARWIRRPSRCSWIWCSSRCSSYNSNSRWWSWAVTRVALANLPSRCNSCSPCKWTYRHKWASTQDQMLPSKTSSRKKRTITFWMKTCLIWQRRFRRSRKVDIAIWQLNSNNTRRALRVKMFHPACRWGAKAPANRRKCLVLIARTRANSAHTTWMSTSRWRTRLRIHVWEAWAPTSEAKPGSKLSRRSKRRRCTQSRSDCKHKPIRCPRSKR